MRADDLSILVADLVAKEGELAKMGEKVIITSQGPYALSEQALFEDRVPAQAEYNALRREVESMRETVKAFDVVARYRANP